MIEHETEVSKSLWRESSLAQNPSTARLPNTSDQAWEQALSVSEKSSGGDALAGLRD